MRGTRTRLGTLIVRTIVPLGTLLVLTVVPAGIASGSVTSGSVKAESAAAAAKTCDLNSIYGHTENQTDVKVETSATHGVTNEWCIAPSGSVAAQGTNDWLAGDNLFETHVNISYRFPDGVVADFHAESRAFTGDRITAGCSVSPAGGKPSPYGCFTRTVYLYESYGEVWFVLVRVAPSS
jgi:hypothetical protein